MSNVTVLDEKCDAYDKKKFNIAEHTKRVFGMYSGEIVRARLSFENSLVNVVLDHFGKDVRMLLMVPEKPATIATEKPATKNRKTSEG